MTTIEITQRHRLYAAWSLAFVVLPLSGCSDAPSQNILGSYFPSWMICALIGIALAAVTHRGLAAAGFADAVPAPLLVYLAFAVFFSFLAWLIWLG